MWYAIVGDKIWFETKTKAQKAVNVRRDKRATVLIEDGQTYDQLRGISLEGRATIVDDPTALLAVGVSVYERYFGPYSEEAMALITEQLRNRVAICFEVERFRSWDHRKLGLPATPLSGSTIST